VRVAVPEGSTPQVLHHQLHLALKCALPNYDMDRRHFVVHCVDKEQQERLLSVDRCRPDGKQIRIQDAEKVCPGTKFWSVSGSYCSRRMNFGCWGSPTGWQGVSKPRRARAQTPTWVRVCGRILEGGRRAS
jgi:hypothetical protein